MHPLLHRRATKNFSGGTFLGDNPLSHRSHSVIFYRFSVKCSLRLHWLVCFFN
nr:MAG TPA: hypothetical protein [Caudoviricetes sp.]